jgi:cell division protein FtsZ
VRVSVVATGIDTVLPQAEATRPRLVAVGNGGAVAVAQPMMAVAQPMGMQQQAAPAPAMHQASAPVSLMGAPVLPQAAEQEPAPAPAPAPVEMARPRPQPMPMVAPAAAPARTAPPARGLFAEQPSAPPVQAPAPRNSLFGIVTGAIRGRAAPQPMAEAPRSEPAFPSHADPAPTVRPAQTEEMGLDIPAFLRRQSS